jgi:diguanylate cyclase (GGDEF)-like protein
MGGHEHGSASPDENDADRLRGVIAHDALSVDLVSAFSGDRPLSAAETTTIDVLKASKGERFHSALLYSMTHQYFAPATARLLWDDVVRHKCGMSKALGRNVQIVVATLDYLANLKGAVELPTVVAESQMAEIVSHSMRDGLTGLYNHTSCFEILDLELRIYARHGTVVSLMVVDIDDFKDVNDRHGHQEGDRALVALASALREGTRHADICCRYGGEEFAVILPLTNAREAGRVAERVRSRASEVRAGDGRLTISAGVACCDDVADTPRAVVRKADSALYEAKRRGKNRVVVA